MRKHNIGSIEPGVKTTLWPFGASSPSVTTGKEGV